MKTNRKLSYILVGLIVILFVIAGNNSLTSKGRTQDNSGIKDEYASVYLDGDLLKFSNKPIIKENKVYVPIEEYAEMIDAEVEFKGKKKIIIKKNKSNLVVNTKDNTAITEKNDNFFIDRINEGKDTLLPIDIISEHFGLKVGSLSDDTIKVYSSLEKYEEIEEQENTDQANDKVEGKETKEVEEVEEVKQPESDKKVAYLTFDDGPNVNTPQILDILKEKEVKATFFMLGSSIQEHEDIAKRVSDEGHALGVHSMTHNFDSVYASPDSFMHEMTITNSALKKATNKETLLLRAPYGSKPYMKEEFRDLATSWGYRIWDWNVDSRDSIKKNTTPDEVYNEVANQVVNQQKAVILFHDREHTIQALPRIIDFLNSQGFEIEKLDTEMTPLNFWNDHR